MRGHGCITMENPFFLVTVNAERVPVGIAMLIGIL